MAVSHDEQLELHNAPLSLLTVVVTAQCIHKSSTACDGL